MPCRANLLSRLSLSALAVHVAASGALASEDASTPFAGTLVDSIVSLLIFIGALVVLRKFAWGPILKMLQDRETFIHDSLADAKKEREAAEAKHKEYDDALNRAREEATEIVNEGRRDAEVVKQRVQAEARSEAEAMVSRAKREIELARDAAVQDLYERTAELATLVAERALRKQLTPAEHDRILSASLEELKTLGRNGAS